MAALSKPLQTTGPVVEDGGTIQKSVYDTQYLQQQCRWIRDDLDSQIARDGPDALHSDDILRLDELLRRVQTSTLSLDDISASRLHNAIISITGQATRWPKRLIERAEAVKTTWEAMYGPLTSIETPLYGPGGRLYGVCSPEDVNSEKLLVKWLKAPGVKLSPMCARRTGDLGYTPGDWWISPLFAFRDGIIDSAEATGHIVADAAGAYAVLMTDDDETSSPTPDTFTYRAKNTDRGRYRLTAATRGSTQPVRILRSHSLRSFWAPKAGVRYDGLHVVVGWSIKGSTRNRPTTYEITFKRLKSELSMNVVLRRPFTDEVEDYKEYKRLRQIARAAQEEISLSTVHTTTPVIQLSQDGTAEVAAVRFRRDSMDDD